MDTIYRSVAGLDVHKKTIEVCVRQVNQQGDVEEDRNRFGTMTRDLLEMSDWLTARGVTHVAMESTGVYWKPIWNILEGNFELLLLNPHDVKQVPGRKTDVTDAQWIAKLLQHGLLRPSFVPGQAQRELRDLTRQRAQLEDERTRVVNRIHKVLEDANIKLASVASDIMGVSGRAMLEALLQGEQDTKKMAHFARGKLKAKIPQLQLALEGRLTEHHRFMLQQLLDHLAHLEDQIAQFCLRIETAMSTFLSLEAQQKLDQIPGVNRTTIENVVAEIGTAMDQFSTSQHLASWAGICPGNEESAGKRKRSRTTKGNRWLRRALSQAAWAASHSKDTYFAAQFRRLAGRRGKKRAIIAVAHSLLVVIYHILKHNTDYQDLGEDYFVQLQPERLKRYLVRRLEQLGYQVTLDPTTDAAA